MGFIRIQTFILATEPGTSLKASGWKRDGRSNPDGGHWDTHPRRSVAGEQQRGVVKLRWVKQLRLDSHKGGEPRPETAEPRDAAILTPR